MSKEKDIIIAGGGPAGLTAAMYASRAGMNTLVLEKAMTGGQLWMSEKIENYPGYAEGIESFNLAQNMEKQAKNFGAEIIKDEITDIKKDKEVLTLKTASSKKYRAPAVIVCSGVRMKKLDIPGESQLTGKGVSYCAVCDGPLFRDKDVAVIGGGNTACEEALYLTRFASKIYLIHRRGSLRAVRSITEKAEKNKKIRLFLNEEVKQIQGKERTEGLILKSGKKIDVEGVFIFIGYSPAAGWIENFVKTEKGFIITDTDFKSSQEGVFAAGDCRYGAFRQVVSACGEGAAAAENARKYVEKLKGTSYDW